MKFLLLVIIAIALVGGQKGRSDQGPPVLDDIDNSDTKISFYEDDFDEDISEMTPDTTQSQEEDGFLETINEKDVDDEIASAERQESYPVWKILLITAGCAVALALMVGAIILVVKSRSNNNEAKSSKEVSEPKDDEGEASIQTPPVHMC